MPSKKANPQPATKFVKSEIARPDDSASTAESGQAASAPRTSLDPVPKSGAAYAVGRQPRTDSKLAILVDRLQRAAGVTVLDVMDATGWRAHTVHAALTGLRRRGFAVIREHNGTRTCYRISSASLAHSRQETAS